MAISIAAIEAKEFKTRLKGYDPEEVDLYLDEICDHIDMLNRQIDAQQQRISQMNQGPSYARSAVPPPAAFVDHGDQAHQELNLARQKAQGILDEARADAAQIRAEAQKMMREAEKMRSDAADALRGAPVQMDILGDQGDLSDLEAQRNALQEEIDMLRAAAKDYRRRFQMLVEDQQHVLNAETELFD